MGVLGWGVRLAFRLVWYGLLLVVSVLRQLAHLTRYLWSFRSSGTHGSARFADGRRIRKLGLYERRGRIVGRYRGRLLRYRPCEHAFTYAPTRKGKGLGAVIPNLLDHPGSVVVVDIKGENLAVTARRRRTFGKVLAFDPFDVQHSAAYNPMDFIRPDHSSDDAKTIADLLVPLSGHPHFDTLARNLVMAMVLHVHHTHWSDPGKRSLQEVCRLLSQPRDDLEGYLRNVLLRSPIADVRQAAGSVQAAGGDELGSIISTATKDLGVWTRERIAAISRRSDLKLEDLKRQVLSVYLHVPPHHLDTYSGWLRMIAGQMIDAMTRVSNQPDDPVLFMLDEFPSLGRMSAIEKGIGYLAGYGVSLWLVTQDLHQVARIYSRESWKSIISNCAIRQTFGVQDIESAELASRMLGTTTVQSHSEGYASNIDQWIGRRNHNQSETGRPLMTPGEIMTLEDDQMLLFCKGWPVLARKIDYRTEWVFRGMWDSWHPTDEPTLDGGPAAPAIT